MGKKSSLSGISNCFIWIVPVDGIEKQEKQRQDVSATVTIDNTVRYWQEKNMGKTCQVLQI